MHFYNVREVNSNAAPTLEVCIRIRSLEWFVIVPGSCANATGNIPDNHSA